MGADVLMGFARRYAQARADTRPCAEAPAREQGLGTLACSLRMSVRAYALLSGFVTVPWHISLDGTCK